MKKAIFTLALMLSAFAGNAQTSLRGDVNNDGTVSLSDIMLLVDIILYEDATQAYTACPDNNHPHLIDLGLPSSTKWSCCNVGASKPEAYGGNLFTTIPPIRTLLTRTVIILRIMMK